MESNHRRDLWSDVEERLRAFDALPDEAFTVQEALEILRIDYRTLRRRMKEKKHLCLKERRIVQFKDSSTTTRLINALTRRFVRRMLEAQGLCSKGHRLTQEACYLHWRKDDERYEVICMECRNEASKEFRRKERERKAHWAAKPLPSGYVRAG